VINLVHVLVAPQKVIGHVHGQNVREQLPIVGLQVLHVLLLLGRLQLPHEVEPSRDFRLPAVHDLAHEKEHDEHEIDEEALGVEEPQLACAVAEDEERRDRDDEEEEDGEQQEDLEDDLDELVNGARDKG
jgi:hypothetical protein